MKAYEDKVIILYHVHAILLYYTVVNNKINIRNEYNGWNFSCMIIKTSFHR